MLAQRVRTAGAQARAAEEEALRTLGAKPDPTRTVRIQDDDALDIDRIERTVVCDLVMGGTRLGQVAFGVSKDASEIDTIAPDYRIGLRHHTEDRWDTCLYFF